MKQENVVGAIARALMASALLALTPAGSASRPPARGRLAPVGPPATPPRRSDAGGHCVIDLRQRYEVTGTLSGTAEIDYRILAYGPCPKGPPSPGRYAERWIAHGTFTGTFQGKAATADFTYTAEVRQGGPMEGRIALGDGLTGELTVTGDMTDTFLSYAGEVTAASGPPQPVRPVPRSPSTPPPCGRAPASCGR